MTRTWQEILINSFFPNSETHWKSLWSFWNNISGRSNFKSFKSFCWLILGWSFWILIFGVWFTNSMAVWQSSISLTSKLTSLSDRIDLPISTNQSSCTMSGMPVKTMLFLCRYWLWELIYVSREIALFLICYIYHVISHSLPVIS